MDNSGFNIAEMNEYLLSACEKERIKIKRENGRLSELLLLTM